MDKKVLIYAGDDRPEQFKNSGHEPLGQFVMVTIGAAKQVIVAGPNASSTAEALQAIQQFYDLTIPETDLLNAQIAAGDRITYLSPQITVAMVEALIKAEDVLRDEHDGEKVHADVCTALRRSGRRLVEKWSQRFWLAFDFFVVAIDETYGWSLPDEWKDKIERIETVYFFDRSTEVHQCSLQADIYLEFFEYRPVFKDSVDSEELQDTVDNYLMKALPDDGTTMSAHDIDRFLEKHAAEPFRVYHYGNPQIDLDEVLEDVTQNSERPLDAADLDQAIALKVAEGVRESIQANCVL